MYYRRKLILAILQIFGDKMDKRDLQKVLFLGCAMQKKPVYHFVPYKFGCYSFSANADLNTLRKYGIVSEDEENWTKNDSQDYFAELEKNDFEIVKTVKLRFEGMLGDELIKYTYKKHPYFAINSTITKALLNKEELKTVENTKPIGTNKTLYTIGYEGISLEEYINKLIKYNVAVLCDVRSNALSMKYGFSKSQLKNVCENVGIVYIHLPELGISSEYRKELKYQSDYDNLFVKYRNEMLPQTTLKQLELVQLLEKYQRIALTCFEADICRCHRLHLAEAVIKNTPKTFDLKHI